MLIYLDKTSCSIDDRQQLYVFDFIAGCNGWLVTEDPADAIIHFQWKDDFNKIEIYRSNGKIYLAVPKNMLLQIFRWLKCEDTSAPEENPAPIERPLADEMVAAIHNQLIDFCMQNQQIFISLHPWPQGKPMAVALTHDVDLVRKYGAKILLADLAGGRWKKFRAHYRESVFSKNIYWNFDEILRFYAQRNLKATFFFLARPWEGIHYRYHIGSKKFRQLFEKILEHGHEIGLHSSRFAYNHPQRIAQEKRRLENAIGQPVSGVRQHYLRLQFPQAWHYFHQAGFQYDSSCGYNHGIGFRAATAGIFSTFIASPASTDSLLEVPITLMDYPWSHYFGSEEQSEIIFENLWNSIDKFHGVMNILWHPSNIVEPAFRGVWQKMFEWLEKKNFYQGTLADLQEWWRKKSALKCFHLQQNSEGLTLSLESSFAMHHLCLNIISGKKLKSEANLQSLSMHHYRWTLPDFTPGVTRLFLKYE